MYLLHVKNRDYLRISVILGIICVGGMILSLYLFDKIVDGILRLIMPITPRNFFFRNIYLELPMAKEFHVHIFDIQNPEEVQNGSKPHFKDIGPYVFYQRTVKVDTIDDDENDTLEYTLKKTWTFQPKLSNGLSGDETVTILHPVLNFVALTANVNRKHLLSIASEAIRFIFKQQTPFWTGRAMDLMFDGIPIDCTSKNFKARTVCALFEDGESDFIQQVNDDATEFKFSLFAPFNDTSSGRFKVYRGKKQLTDLGRIVEINGKPDIGKWNTKEENEFKGTDGYWIPAFRNIHDHIWAYEHQICAALELKYVRRIYDRGIPLRTFSSNLDRFATNKAYCRENGSCPIQGTIDLLNCFGVPIFATLPHFLDTHPSLMANIQSGLQPDRRAHEITCSIDLKSGVPFLVSKRLQINFELTPIPQVEVMANLPNMIFPFIWVEESLKLFGLQAALIYFSMIVTRQFIWIFKILCFSVIPLAAIASLTVHILIQHDQIQTIEDTSESIDKGDVVETITTIHHKNSIISHG